MRDLLWTTVAMGPMGVGRRIGILKGDGWGQVLAMRNGQGLMGVLGCRDLGV